MEQVNTTTPPHGLKTLRRLGHLTQSGLAERLDTTTSNVSRWERGVSQPGPYFRQKLCEFFHINAHELDLLLGAATNASDNEKLMRSEPASCTDALFDTAIPFLAPEMPSLIGREEIVDQLVCEICQGTGSFALTGLPGMGKTALAMSLAHHPQVHKQFSDGILWVGLGRYPQVQESLGRWGMLLGLSAPEMGVLTTPAAWTHALHQRINRRRMLLIIDDAWALPDAITFRLGGNNCVHLLTTRFPALAHSFAREHTLHLQDLQEIDSLRLLAQLAPQVVEEYPAETRKLARAVGGLPLALTLMGRYLYVQSQSGQARRVRTALQQLLQNVEQRLQLAEPCMPWEHSTSLPADCALSLQAAIEVSEQALPLEARTALYSLSIFPSKPSSFSEEAALEICEIKGEVLDQLVDGGLLESYQSGRYRLHQTISDYAQHKQRDPGKETRLVHYFTEFVQQQQSDYDALEQDLHMITSALDIAFECSMDVELMRGTLALAPFLEARGLYTLANALFTRALHTAQKLDALAYSVIIQVQLGRIAELQNELQSAEQIFLASLEVAQQLSDRSLIGQILVQIGGVVVDQGDFERAEAYLHAGLAIVRELNDCEYLCIALERLGEITDSQGNSSEGDGLYLESLAIARQIGNHSVTSALLQNLGVKASMRTDYRQALAYYNEGLDLARQINDVRRQSAFLMNLGLLAFHKGQLDKAIALSLESLQLARAINHRMRISSVLQNLGMFEGLRGNHEQAEIYLRESLDIARDTGFRWLINETLGVWGTIYLRQHKFEDARKMFQTMLTETRNMQARELIAQALFGLAQVAVHEGRDDEACRYGRESLMLFEHLDYKKFNEVANWLDTLP